MVRMEDGFGLNRLTVGFREVLRRILKVLGIAREVEDVEEDGDVTRGIYQAIPRTWVCLASPLQQKVVPATWSSSE